MKNSKENVNKKEQADQEKDNENGTRGTRQEHGYGNEKTNF